MLQLRTGVNTKVLVKYIFKREQSCANEKQRLAVEAYSAKGQYLSGTT